TFAEVDHSVTVGADVASDVNTTLFTSVDVTRSVADPSAFSPWTEIVRGTSISDDEGLTRSFTAPSVSSRRLQAGSPRSPGPTHRSRSLQRAWGAFCQGIREPLRRLSPG